MVESTDFWSGDELEGVLWLNRAVARACLSLSSNEFGSDDSNRRRD
jgi:hypothetical protein